MKTALFTARRTIEIRETESPRLERPGDVLVRIDRVGVCGSDVHYYAEGRIGDQVVEYPATLGHECAGTVVEVGPEVTNLRPGDRVAVDPAITCGQCDQCRSGRGNTCRSLRFMGCPGEVPGAASELYVLPAANCYPIPESMSLDEAALAEPLSIGLYAVRLARLKTQPRIGILGSGPIGLSVLLCAKMEFGGAAYVTDLLPERLGVAEGCGADWTGCPEEIDTTAEIAGREPLGLDAVFDCSGDPACIDQAIDLLKPGGTVLMVGIPPVERLSFDAHVVRRREVALQAVRRQIDSVAPVVEAIASGRLDAGPLLTHRFPLARLGEAFELVAGYRDGVVKAMIDMPSG